jgi:hypothetical protein
MLYTYETLPQVSVTLGPESLPAVCHNLTCSFSYTDQESELTSFTYTASTRLLTVTGTNFMTNIDKYQRVEYAKSSCTIDVESMKGAGFECTLDKTPTCGDYKPIVTTIYGNIKVKDTVAD